MAKALVKSPGRKAASRTTGTRARTKPKSKATKGAARTKAQSKKAAKAKPPAKGKSPAKGKAPSKAKASAKPTKPAKVVAAKGRPAKAASAKVTKAPKSAAPKPGKGSRSTTPPAAVPQVKVGDPRGQLKERFAKLSQAKSQISGLKRSIHKSFFDVGVILNQIRDQRLYEVKGYGSFESFVEREIDLNKVVCLRSARIAVAITRDEAEAAGLERASAAVAALDGEEPQAGGFRPLGSPLGAIPVHKR